MVYSLKQNKELMAKIHNTLFISIDYEFMTVVAASHCLQQDHQRRRNATGEPVQGIRRKIIQKNLKKLEPEKGYTCYLCRQKGHLMRSCPLRNQAKSSLETHNVVVDGKILYFNLEAKILIDTSALHAFIFARFPKLLSLRPEILELSLQLIYMSSSPSNISLYLIWHPSHVLSLIELLCLCLIAFCD